MGFSIIDYVVLVGYILLIIGMSFFFMRGQRNTADYFLGNRLFHWFPLAISLYVSIFSPISFISSPGRAYNQGMTMYLYSIFAVLGALLGIKFVVPFFRRLFLTTAYEYLEKRFTVGVRLLASLLFILLRLLYLGVVLYATSIALRPITGWTNLTSILIVGLVAMFYTTMGGMKTVVWSDVLQFTIICGGLFLIVFLLAREHPDGFTGIWMNARMQGRTFTQLAEKDFYRFNPFVTTFWGIFIFSVFAKFGYATADQTSIQRYLSARNEKDASKTFLWGTLLSIPVQFLLYFAGIGLYYFYSIHPEKTFTGFAGDHALAQFIAHELPVGIRGLLMAAILAAVMSTVDSVLNSLSACTIIDFYKRLFRPQASEKECLKAAKLMTVFWGVAAIFSAIAIISLYGENLKRNPLMTVSNATIGFFIGILLAVFLLGILTKRANSMGIYAGICAGLAAVLSVSTLYYFRELPPDAPKLSFTWIGFIGCFVTFAVGYAVSHLKSAPAPDIIAEFTYRGTKDR